MELFYWRRKGNRGACMLKSSLYDAFIPQFYTCSKVHTIKSLQLFTFLKPEMWYATPRLECSPKRIKHTANHFISPMPMLLLLFANFIFTPFVLYFTCCFSLATQLLAHFNIYICCNNERHTMKVLAKLLTLSSCACFVCAEHSLRIKET